MTVRLNVAIAREADFCAIRRGLCDIACKLDDLVHYVLMRTILRVGELLLMRSGECVARRCLRCLRRKTPTHVVSWFVYVLQQPQREAEPQQHKRAEAVIGEIDE